MKKITKIAIAGGTVTAVMAGGAAFAYWSSTGTGSGTAATGTQTSNLAISSTAVTGLAPGVAAKTISGSIVNNGTNNAYVQTLTASIASVTKATGAAAGTCDATDYTLASPTVTVNYDIATGATRAFTGPTIAFNNKATNQDACQGATVNLSYATS